MATERKSAGARKRVSDQGEQLESLGDRIPTRLKKQYHATAPTGVSQQHLTETVIGLWLSLPRQMQLQLLIPELRPEEGFSTLIMHAVQETLRAHRVVRSAKQKAGRT